jgi:predicted dehydrogenase
MNSTGTHVSEPKAGDEGKATRRDLLRGAVAAVAVPYIVPAAVLGAPGKTAPSDRIAIGCIGTGGRGTSLLRSFLPLKEGRITAVCDVFSDRRARAAKLGGKGCFETGDFRKILVRKDIDAVVIAPQDHWHALIAVAAAKAGKAIYCEKPLGVSVAESQAIRNAAGRYRCVFQTGTQQRSSRNFRFACELARSGYLGKVHTVVVGAPGPSYQPKYRGPAGPQPVPAALDYEMFMGPAAKKPYNPGRHAWPDWYLIWDYCTGFIVNWGVHHLDIACWGCPDLATKPFELTCKGSYRNKGLTDNLSDWQGQYVYPGGLKMSFTDSGHPNAQGCKFVGDKGWVHVNRRGIRAEPAALLKVVLRPEDVHLHKSNHHQGDFLRAVRTGGKVASPVEAGHAASRLGLLGEIACRVKRKLTWDPKTETFTGDKQANRLLSRPMRPPWTL